MPASNANVNIKLVFNNLPKLTAQMKTALALVVDRTAHEIEANAKTSLSGPKGGRVYDRKGHSHQASAPGEAPANDYGALGNSIQVTNTGELSRRVDVGEEYGAILETGGAKVEARPFMGPSAELARPGFEAGAKGALP